MHFFNQELIKKWLPKEAEASEWTQQDFIAHIIIFKDLKKSHSL